MDSEFRELFSTYYRTVCGRLTLILGDSSIAEDVAQEAFLKLYLRVREGGSVPANPALIKDPQGDPQAPATSPREPGQARLSGGTARLSATGPGGPNRSKPGGGGVGPEQFKDDIMGAWIMRVAVNIAYNYLRGEKRRIGRERGFFLQSADFGNTHCGGSPREAVESPVCDSPEMETVRREEVGMVREVLARMPLRDRMLLVLRYSGWPYSDIADAIGVKKSSVGSLLARARLRFRNEYMGRTGGDG